MFETAEDVPASAADVEGALSSDRSITHVGVIHCESSFGALEIDASKITSDALIAASGKCIEEPPGDGICTGAQIRIGEMRGQFQVSLAGPA